jgi:hypothetical protein
MQNVGGSNTPSSTKFFERLSSVKVPNQVPMRSQLSWLSVCVVRGAVMAVVHAVHDSGAESRA